MKVHATIRINLSSENHLKIMLKALEPEAKSQVTSRSRVHLEAAGDALTLFFEAEDTSALRSAINSYLRLTSVVIDTLKFIGR